MTENDEANFIAEMGASKCILYIFLPITLITNRLRLESYQINIKFKLKR